MSDAYRIILSKRVAADLISIHDHIAKDSDQNAAAVIEKILVELEALKTAPHRNVIEGQHPRLANPVRSLPVPPYVIFFRAVDEHRAVHILRIRHGAMRRLRRYD
jgi:plasmid stabilization system protein ParE